MDTKVITYSTLWCLVDLDEKAHRLKDLATLLLSAMTDWKGSNQNNISEFISDLNKYFGTPLTVNGIKNIKFDGQNAWQIETGISIVELIEISSKYYNRSNLDEVVAKILEYYNEIFEKVDFIAELSYLTAKSGGRSTFARSGCRAQLKFETIKMQSSVQQTFIDRDAVYPGDKILAKIKIGSPHYLRNGLTEGMKFEFKEGSTVIGTGEIKCIVNDSLEKASR